MSLFSISLGAFFSVLVLV